MSTRKPLRTNEFWPGVHILSARSDAHPALEMVPLDTSAYPRGMHTGVGMANDIGQKLAELEAVVL